MGSTFGQLFRISTWGESHGGGVGVVVDGCPPLVPLCEEDIQVDLDRRRPGQSEITTPRNEEDKAEILSGTFEGKTLGSPIAVLVRNKDHRPEAYSEMSEKFRPSHADYTYQAKYGIRNWQGGGRSSARETIGRVAAAAIAKKVINDAFLHRTLKFFPSSSRSERYGAQVDTATVTREMIESNIVRTGDPECGPGDDRLDQRGSQRRELGRGRGRLRDSQRARGLGMPVFDRLEADLAKGMLSLPATKGFEIGSGIQRNDDDRTRTQ
jgi:chorismate synthase